jgi:hypothetical protein
MLLLATSLWEWILWAALFCVMMAGDIKAKFGTNNQTITVSVASLTNTSARQSTEIDNTTNVFTDALVSVKVKSGAASTSSTGTINVFAFATTDGGTTRTENAGATDAAITLTVPTNARLIGVINVVANATTYYGGPFSVAAAFGGVLPDHWGVIIENKSGGTLDTTAGNHLVTYQGVYAQYT